MALAPVAAFADTRRSGIYQTDDRKMDYQVALCGADGKQLCVKLLALRGKRRRAAGAASCIGKLYRRPGQAGRATTSGRAR